MRRAALAVLLGFIFIMTAGVLAADDGAMTGDSDFEVVPETMGPGAFLLGADTGGAIIIAGPFCDQLDIICDARCNKIGGVYTCVGASTGFCSVSNCTSL